MNLLKAVAELIERKHREDVFRATVTGTSGNLVTIRRTGQASADPQSYPALASYSMPAANDEVIVMRVGDGLIVIGKVVR